MAEEFRPNRLEVPDDTPACAMPIQPPDPMLDELQAMRKDPGTHMTPSFHKVTIRGSNGQLFESRIKSNAEEITNVITGQRDTYRDQLRLESQFEIKDQNGLTSVKTIFGPRTTEGKESIHKQTGERRGHDGSILGRFEINFEESGKATKLTCTDPAGNKTWEKEPVKSDQINRSGRNAEGKEMIY